MIMNKSGLMGEKIYQELTNRFQNIKLHEYVIMPNHMHCIIEITDEYIKLVKNKIVLPFDEKLWQKGFMITLFEMK